MVSDAGQRRLRGTVAHLGVLIDLVVVCGGLLYGASCLSALVAGLARFELSALPNYIWVAAVAPLALVPALTRIGCFGHRAEKITTICLGVLALHFAIGAAFISPRLLILAIWPLLSLAPLLLQRRLASRIRDGNQPISEAWSWKTRFRRLLQIPMTVVFILGCSMPFISIEQLRGLAWPKSEAKIVSCELADQDKWSFHLEYEFEVEGQRFVGHRDTVWMVRGRPWNLRPQDRVASLNQSPKVLVAYNPNSPAQNLLSPGLTSLDFIIVWQCLFYLGGFLMSWQSLFVDRRRLTDRAGVVRYESPGWIAFGFFGGGAFLFGIAYCFAESQVLGIWPILLVVQLSLGYSITVRIQNAWHREYDLQKAKGKILLIGNQCLAT